MRKESVILILCAITLVCAVNDGFWLVKTARGASTIIVPDDYSTIQEAINSAADGDTISVKAGTYYEHVVVNKTVSLVGENRDTTAIDGNGTGHVIDVTRDYVNVANFTVRKGGSIMFPDFNAGISLNNARGCVISSNNIDDNGCFGIHLLNSDQNTISGNNFTHNAMYAIDLTESNGNTISFNTATFNTNIAIGMHITSNNNIIAGNAIVNNTYGIDAANASNNTISNNYVANNSEIGIWIQDNVITNVICGNNVTGSRYCIKIEGQSNYNTIVQNTLSENRYGLYIASSTQNTIFNNNIIGNSQQVYVDSGSINAWNGSYPSGGNFWSDYGGADQFGGPYQNVTGSDGMGDTPYTIDAFNVDHFPLMLPYNPSPVGGDLNADGTVDIFDIVIVALEFGRPPPPIEDERADVNKDGVVDIFDIAIVAIHFGESKR